MKKTALLTGINGQDGSYLAELLLSKGYIVHGIIRSSSVSNSRIDHILDKIILHFSDLAETANLVDLMYSLNPDEVYALGAQSHVKISFEVPEFTSDITGIGTLRLLEAIRKACPKARFYQAGSSEQFGSSLPPQNESTLFKPESPYAVAKIFSYHMVHVYRKAYGLFATNGLLFNHESILYESPLIIKDDNNLIDVLPIGDIFKSHRWEGILDYYKKCDVWNGLEFTKIIGGTSYQEKNKPMKLVQTVSSCYEATLDHVAFDENDNEIYTSDWKIGDNVFDISYPSQNTTLSSDTKLAMFLGFVCGDGSISEGTEIRLTGCDKEELVVYGDMFSSLYGIQYKLSNCGPGQYENCKNDIWSLKFNCPKTLCQWLRSLLYTKNKEKRVPKYILNSSIEIKKAFFDGYYAADGRKKGNEQYEYKGFTTSSATLCLGLIYIFKSFSIQRPKVKCEYRDGKRYYYTCFTTDKIDCKFGKGVTKNRNEIINIIDTSGNEFFDIQTESKTFATGPNLFKVHNSERRGENFVTRKITRAATRIKLGLQDKLTLGNIDAHRDWGHARDYVRAMWMMLQHTEPDDFVVCSGSAHSVRDFLEIAFNKLDLDPYKYLEIDKNLFRPSEVDYLCGDSTKIKNILGWEPEISFADMVSLMIDYDMALAEKELKYNGR